MSRSALRKNVDALARLADGRILAVCVKANAYGHGLAEITSMLTRRDDVEYLTVHSSEEAVACRIAGWKRKIMVLGPIPDDFLKTAIEWELEPVICSRQSLVELGKRSDALKKPMRTHLKLETGTNRQGITEKEIGAFAAIYKKYKYLKKPYGASTHFANIEDTTSHEFAQSQLDRFNRLVSLMTRHGIKPTIRHTACSAALILFEKTRFELVRPGISVYGHWPSKETYLSYRLEGGANDIFSPLLSWRVRITQIKTVPAGGFIGYGCTYRTTTRTRLAVLPVGYSDGYSRSLSNTAYVLIKGKRAPVRGRVCMNLIMVDISQIEGVKVGDIVTLIGKDGRERLSVEQLANWSGTISYEVLSRLSKAIRRIQAR